jgi:hypothetical protein
MRNFECPNCGRPFVTYVRLAEHVAECNRQRQRRLDREWEEKVIPQKAGEAKP